MLKGAVACYKVQPHVKGWDRMLQHAAAYHNSNERSNSFTVNNDLKLNNGIKQSLKFKIS